MRLPAKRHGPRKQPSTAIAVLLSAFVVASGVGCGDGSDEASGDTRPLVTFGRTGGSESTQVYGLVVERGGGATLTQYPEKFKRFELDGGTRDELRSALEDLDMERLDANYEPNPPSAEGHRYSVTYRGTTVQAAEKADVPKKLKSVIKLLDELIDDER